LMRSTEGRSPDELLGRHGGGGDADAPPSRFRGMRATRAPRLHQISGLLPPYRLRNHRKASRKGCPPSSWHSIMKLIRPQPRRLASARFFLSPNSADPEAPHGCGLHPKKIGRARLQTSVHWRGAALGPWSFITHCHLDHIGSLPVLLRGATARGCPVIMNPASHMLIERMLHNSLA